MKVLFSIILVILLSLPAFAEIIEQKEKGNKTQLLTSIFKENINPWEEVKFLNEKGKENNIITTLILFSSEPGLWFFDEKDMEVKIDGENYKAKFIITKSTWNVQLRKETRMVAFLIDQKLKEKLQAANQVAMKLFCKNREDIEWIVPSFVLDEWKKVIENK